MKRKRGEARKKIQVGLFEAVAIIVFGVIFLFVNKSEIAKADNFREHGIPVTAQVVSKYGLSSWTISVLEFAIEDGDKIQAELGGIAVPIGKTIDIYYFDSDPHVVSTGEVKIQFFLIAGIIFIVIGGIGLAVWYYAYRDSR